MSSKRVRATARTLRRRILLSFGTLAAAGVGGVLAFFSVSGEKQIGGAPNVLRSGFHWNERVWRNRFRSSRLSPPEAAPSPGTVPRVNGDLGLTEDVPSDYQLIVQSEDGHTKTLRLPDLKAIARTVVSTRFKCIEGWSIPIQYEGVRFSDFMRALNLGRKADGSYYRYVGLVTPDGEYYVSLDMESMLHAQTVLADRMNGAPLSEENGAPLRLVIPIKYGIKSLKRVGKVVFSDHRPPDYWAERGYDWYSGL